MNNNHLQKDLARFSSALGKGILAGLVGTAVMTVAQIIEMQLTNREPSTVPAKIAGKVLGVKPKGRSENEEEEEEEEVNKSEEEKKDEERKKQNRQKFSQIVHLGYGTAWGMIRGIISESGLKGFPATALHFTGVWATELVMLPSMNAAKPITRWKPEQIANDVLLHAIYATATGLTYDYLDNNLKK